MNDFNLKPGILGQARTMVTGKNTAKEYGSGSIDVFGTPAMVALMEEEAINAVDKLLPTGYATVGTRLDISHIAVTPMGMNVTASAKLTSIDGRKLAFEVEAFDEKGKIGSDTHNRYIIELVAFLERARQKE